MPDVHQLLRGDRRRLLAAGAVKVLAEQGARGLTHRRLDSELGLPEGSTSNAFATRDALFQAALASLAEPTLEAMHEAAERLPDRMDPGVAADLLAGTVFGWLEPGERPRLIARFELIMEATRRPALQGTLGEIRAAFNDIAERLSRAAGAPDAQGAAPLLVSLADGILIAHLSAQANPPTRAQLAGAARSILMSTERQGPRR